MKDINIWPIYTPKKIEYNKEYEDIKGIIKKYVEKENFKGWDPYDGLNSKIFQLTPFKKWDLARLAWIQGFKMHGGGSGLSYKDYILAQMKGARESNGDGFVVWNAGSDYEETFLAMEEYKGYLASKN